jgi:predicted acylesterase/phospholipase RssA
MLTIEPARQRRTGTRKLAIALAGGGPLGAFYELGTLHALSEAIVGRSLTAFDVYVGVSSGSLLASGLANGFDTTAMGTSLVRGEATRVPFSPGILLSPALREYAGRLARLPTVLASSARQYARDPLRTGWAATLRSLARVLPTAAFDNAPLERYLRRIFDTSGHTDDFRKLAALLYVVATDLDTGESVVFGAPGHDEVRISRAVVASAALPGLYPAVEIGGRHYVDGALIRTMHASLALEAGCELVICINPLVPFDAARRGRRRRRLAHEGIDAILGQTFRALIHSRMQVGMASYGARFPRADTLLFEPDRHDETLFFTNVFRYSGRRRLAEHAYQQTRRDLDDQAATLAGVLRPHGLELDLERLRDRRRTLATAARERAVHAREMTTRLRGALSRLERLLARSEACTSLRS